MTGGELKKSKATDKRTPRSRKTEKRTTQPVPGSSRWFGWLGAETKSGVDVGPETALTLSAVFACVRLLSQSVAQLPIHVYADEADGKVRLPNHELNAILRRPHPEISGYIWKQTIVGWVLTYGNGYAMMQMAPSGRLVFQLVHPCYICPKRDKDTNELVYEYRHPSLGTKIIPQWQMLHYKFFSRDGINGLSVITLARETIGLGLASENYGATFFGAGGRPVGIISGVAKTKDIDKIKVLRTSWKESISGDPHAPVVLPDGLTFEPWSVPPQDMQFVQTRSFSVTEIARWYGVQPHLIQDLTRSTNNNIEHQSLEFLRYTLNPMLAAIEQETNYKLFGNDNSVFVEFVTEAFLRGDTKSRYDAYRTAIAGGFMSPNEARKKDNMNVVEGLDLYSVPLNAAYIDGTTGQFVQLPAPVKSAPKTPSEIPTPAETQGRAAPELLPGQETRQIESGADLDPTQDKVSTAFSNLFQRAYERLLNREVIALRRALKKTDDKEQMRKQATEFFSAHTEVVMDHLAPIYESQTLVSGIETDIDEEVRKWISQSRGKVLGILDHAEDWKSELTTALQEWRDIRAKNIDGENHE